MMFLCRVRVVVFRFVSRGCLGLVQSLCADAELKY
jgi:hypothetical protein